MSEFDPKRMWDYYQGEAPDSFGGAKGRLSYIMARIPRSASSVLNVGIGSGLLEKMATARGLEAFALDPSEVAVDRVRSELRLGERAQVGSVVDIPFGNGAFDAVVVSEVLEHLDDAQLAASVPELYRVIAPGGRLLVTVPAREDLEQQIVVCPGCGATFHRWGHQQSFDRQRLSELLSPPFAVTELSERPFITWETLNWKGKTDAVARLALSRVGVRSTADHLFLLGSKQ